MPPERKKIQLNFFLKKRPYGNDPNNGVLKFGERMKSQAEDNRKSGRENEDKSNESGIKGRGDLYRAMLGIALSRQATVWAENDIAGSMGNFQRKTVQAAPHTNPPNKTTSMSAGSGRSSSQGCGKSNL